MMTMNSSGSEWQSDLMAMGRRRHVVESMDVTSELRQQRWKLPIWGFLLMRGGLGVCDGLELMVWTAVLGVG